MTYQVALTIITRIKPGEAEEIKQLLKTMGNNVAQNDSIPFGKLSTIHFARLMVLDESVDLNGAVISPSLVFISECDVPLDRLLNELVDRAGEGLDEIYSHCEGYPTDGEVTRTRRLAYLRACMIKVQAFYVNTVGRTVQQIRQEAQLRNAIQELVALEDFVAQNQFSAIGYIKPGWFRRLTVLGILLAANYGTRHIFNKENLAGVKTIHYARWVVIDEQRRVIFASNYDGSLESYNDDFIDKVAWKLNASFSNGVGYPKTNWLIFDGAKDEQAFKDYIRVHQIPTQVWYSAYDNLTALNIANNARIRAGLYGDMSEAETEEWLRL